MADERSRQMMTCMFRDREAAERGYGCLTSRGYGKNDVSLLMSEEARNRHFPKTATTTELGSKAAEGAGIGAATGGGLGALLLGLAAAGFAIPGLPILAMGPLAAALTGAGAGGAVGAGTVMATRGKAATLPSETRISFRLRDPVTVTERLR